jgi:hypothetical protein
MATQTLVTYGTVVKTEIGKDHDLHIEWELDGGMRAFQSFNMKTQSGQKTFVSLCKAAGLIQVKATEDFAGKRCRVTVSTHTPCKDSNTFYFVVGFDV